MSACPIEVEALRCTYGDHVAVDGLELTVARGELFALLGTNGAGKTTAMETLEGHRRPAAGRVRVLGADPAGDRRVIGPRVGIMLQQSGFAAELTVAETIHLWDALRSRPGDPDGALERVGLTHRADVQVRQLSGGEHRRLELALAICGSPEVLFLDEPTTGLDPQSRRRTWAVISELVATGTAVLLTTHYLEEAEALADGLAILDRGRVVASGTVAEVVGGLRARISFRLPSPPPEPPPEPLPELAGRLLPGRAGEVVIETGDLAGDLEALLGWRRRHDVRIERLTAREASLRGSLRGGHAMIVRQIRHLAVAELRLIWRNRGLAVLVLGLPLAIAASLAIGTGAGDWGELAGAQLLLMLLLGVYTTATTTVVARRQQLVLKRLRSGELSKPC